MTTHPSPAAEAADAELGARCDTSGQYLAGLIATGMLDTIGRPDKLPELLWPDTDPAVVRDIWQQALAVGYRAGKDAGIPRWTREGLDRLLEALRDAGYEGMATRAARSHTHRGPLPPHPAHEQAAVRDGDHP